MWISHFFLVLHKIQNFRLAFFHFFRDEKCNFHKNMFFEKPGWSSFWIIASSFVVVISRISILCTWIENISAQSNINHLHRHLEHLHLLSFQWAVSYYLWGPALHHGIFEALHIVAKYHRQNARHTQDVQHVQHPTHTQYIHKQQTGFSRGEKSRVVKLPPHPPPHHQKNFRLSNPCGAIVGDFPWVWGILRWNAERNESLLGILSFLCL